MIRTHLFAIFLGLTSPLSVSLSQAAEPDPRPQMNALAQELAGLQKFLLSEAEFVKPENEKAIQGSLDSMRRHLKAMEGREGPFAKDPALRANLEMLTRHITDTDRNFQRGNKPFARYMLQSSLQMCVACHTRGEVKWDFALPEDQMVQSASPMERAEFLFATRQFDKGKERYMQVLEGYPGNKVAKADLEKALNALAIYYVRVKADPAGGAKAFGVLAKESWLSDLQREELRAWERDLKAWSQEKKVTRKGAASHLAQANRLLKGDDFSLADSGKKSHYVSRLRASAELHEVLESGAKPAQKGEALYLLGRIYQRVNHQLFFRYGELYLKACVQEHSKTPIAAKCYGALERAVMEGYTGSAGTEIPADEQEELARLKRLAI